MPVFQLQQGKYIFIIIFFSLADGPRNISCTPDSRSLDVQLSAYAQIQCTAVCNPSCSYRWTTRGKFSCDNFEYDLYPSYAHAYHFYFYKYTHSLQNSIKLYALEKYDGILTLNISDQYGAKLVDFNIHLYRKYNIRTLHKLDYITCSHAAQFSFCYDYKCV